MDIISTLQGLSFSLPTLLAEISKQGFEVKKIHFDRKQDRFVAKAQHQNGVEVESWGRTEVEAVSSLLYNIMARSGPRMAKAAAWQKTFTDQLIPIAEAYSKAPVYEPKAAQAFMALARDSKNRARLIKEQLKVQIVNDPDPYPSAEKLCEDIRKRKTLMVSRVSAEHPLWSEENVIDFRISFDVLGYCAAEAKFDWEGANRAFAAYASLVGEQAQKALFSEVIGQSAYATYYRNYGPAKICLLRQFTDEAQEKENPHQGYQGVHPSQMLLPGELPEAKAPSLELTAKIDRDEHGNLPKDINWGWESGQGVIQPYDQVNDDVLGLNDLDEHLAKLNSGWSDFLRKTKGDNAQAKWEAYQETDPSGAVKVKIAVSNVLRAAILSPKKALHHNAVQYQDLLKVPYNSTDPNDYWDALEEARQNWNVQRFGEVAYNEHRPWNRSEKKQDAPIYQLAKLIHHEIPYLGTDAIKVAQNEIRMRKDHFQRFLTEHLSETEKAKEDPYIIDDEANDMVLAWIKRTVEQHQEEGIDIYDPLEENEMTNRYAKSRKKKRPLPATGEGALERLPKQPPRLKVRKLDTHPFAKDKNYEDTTNHNIFNLGRYPGFMGEHIKQICYATKHLDEIIEAALADVHDHDGSGHHFRVFILSLKIKGIGPKIASFMWLLLQPLTTQLATLDVHMAKILGYQETDITDREYFRMERELIARRDALGLSHIPLGKFQWGLWDLARMGLQPSSDTLSGKKVRHQDHSALAVLNSTAAHNVLWWPSSKEEDQVRYRHPLMDVSKPASDRVVKDWNNTVAQKFPSGSVVPTSPNYPVGDHLGKTASSLTAPWLIHPKTGEKVFGFPGQTIAQLGHSLGLSITDLWQKIPDELVSKNG